MSLIVESFHLGVDDSCRVGGRWKGGGGSGNEDGLLLLGSLDVLDWSIGTILLLEDRGTVKNEKRKEEEDGSAI